MNLRTRISRLAAVAFLAGTAAVPGVTARADVLSGPDGGIGAFPLALLASIANPDAPPPGANDWHCRPSPAHPRPVVLVHGTFENGFDAWNAMAPALAASGYCVFAPNLGAAYPHALLKGTADIDASARGLAAFVDEVLGATHASRVDLVGHSQGGGVLPRQYLRFHGGADAADPARNKVNALVGINPSNHGTAAGNLLAPAAGLPVLDRILQPAVVQQSIGSALNDRLDAGGDTMPGVHYTVLTSAADEVVVPFSQSFLTAGPGATVDDIVLQDVCPVDLSDHLASPYDDLVIQLVENALDPEHPRSPECRIALPVLGTV